jgi:hypothetical protein
MSLNSRSIAKILREHFIGDRPLTKNPFEHKECLLSIKDELKKIRGVDMSRYRSSLDKDSKQVHFVVQEDDDSSYRDDSFTIKFNKQNQLIVEHFFESYGIVYQIEQIYSFIDRVKEAHEQKKARELKTQKINKLKQQAIIAKIKEIAKEDQFDFYIREYQRKLKLAVRIEGDKFDKLVEVDIPYGQFQDILKDLRSFIQTLRELQKSGINFKLKTDSGDTGYGWISHESL